MSEDAGTSNALSRARESMRQGSLETADAMVNDVLARAPRDADALCLRAAIANRRRDHAAAIVASREAVTVRPELSAAWLELANAYARLDQCDPAVVAYREVLAREPAWPNAHFNLGLMQRRLGERMGAARSFYEAWSRDPELLQAAGYCVATLGECVREGDRVAAEAPMMPAGATAVSVVICSIDEREARPRSGTLPPPVRGRPPRDYLDPERTFTRRGIQLGGAQQRR